MRQAPRRAIQKVQRVSRAGVRVAARFDDEREARGVTTRAREKTTNVNPRANFPAGCTCLDWSYFRRKRPRPLCPVHRIPDRTVDEEIAAGLRPPRAPSLDDARTARRASSFESTSRDDEKENESHG
jgi:hypothetical protein